MRDLRGLIADVLIYGAIVALVETLIWLRRRGLISESRLQRMATPPATFGARRRQQQRWSA